MPRSSGFSDGLEEGDDGDTADSAALFFAALRLLRKSQKPAARSAKTTIVAPTPMPAAAPVDRPDELVKTTGALVAVADAVAVSALLEAAVLLEDAVDVEEDVDAEVDVELVEEEEVDVLEVDPPFAR